MTLKGSGAPYRYDAWTGVILPIVKYTRTTTGRRIDVDLATGDSELIALTRNNRDIPTKRCTVAETTTTAAVEGDYRVVELVAVAQQPGTVRVKLLAVTGDTRVPSAPDVATFREQGLDYMDAIESWFGVIAPAKTPRPVIAKLNQDIRAVMELPQVREQMAKQGMVSKTGTPEEFDALVKADLLRWAKLASDMKITAE